jgi:hypothetical protein
MLDSASADTKAVLHTLVEYRVCLFESDFWPFEKAGWLANFFYVDICNLFIAFLHQKTWKAALADFFSFYFISLEAFFSTF